MKTSEEIEQAINDEVESIRQSTLDYLNQNPDVTLKNLLEYLNDFNLMLISRAVSGLLISSQVELSNPGLHLRVGDKGVS